MGGNIQKLGNVLSDRMKKSSAAAVPTTLELGVINNDFSLTTDSLKVAIPKGDYMVNLVLASKTYNTSTATHEHSGELHYTHDHRLPEDFRALKGGDRVLVAWCGSEPVVIAIVVSS